MIKDRLENAKIYYNLSENLKKGFEWLEHTDLKNIDNGHYVIDGEDVFASVQTYETKEDANYETHRKYIDIQYMIKGFELVGATDISNCETCIEYDLEKDLEFYICPNQPPKQTLNEGEFLVFYPHDAHQPSICPKEKSLVKKVVVKVAVK